MFYGLFRLAEFFGVMFIPFTTTSTVVGFIYKGVTIIPLFTAFVLIISLVKLKTKRLDLLWVLVLFSFVGQPILYSVDWQLYHIYAPMHYLFMFIGIYMLGTALSVKDLYIPIGFEAILFTVSVIFSHEPLVCVISSVVMFSIMVLGVTKTSESNG